MTLIEGIICGIIQGVTEFLPVSSSGHLAIAHGLFNFNDATSSNLTFDILLHLATLIAVFIVYYKEIFSLIPAFFTMIGKAFRGKFKTDDYTPNERFVLAIIISTLPLVAAVFVKDYVEILSNYCKIVGGILILNGIVLLLGEHFSKKGKTVGDVKPLDALLIGICQMFALLPGLSRSGSTISGGILRGLDRQEAVKYSFILSVPAIIGANIFNIGDIKDNPIPQSEIGIYIAGFACALVFGFAAIKLLIYISKKATFRPFAYYCFAAGLAAVIFG